MQDHARDRRSAFGTIREIIDSFFNPADENIITKGNLPQWYQKDVFFFITFRLADSMPKGKVEVLK